METLPFTVIRLVFLAVIIYSSSLYFSLTGSLRKRYPTIFKRRGLLSFISQSPGAILYDEVLLPDSEDDSSYMKKIHRFWISNLLLFFVIAPAFLATFDFPNIRKIIFFYVILGLFVIWYFLVYEGLKITKYIVVNILEPTSKGKARTRHYTEYGISAFSEALSPKYPNDMKYTAMIRKYRLILGLLVLAVILYLLLAPELLWKYL